MRTYSISWSFEASSQFEMVGQMGMEEPFYNDQPMILSDYYKCAIISLHTTSAVFLGKVRCISMCIYSISWSLKTSGQFEMAGQMGMEEPFYNDRPMVLQDSYKYAIISLYTTSTLYLGIVRCSTMRIYSIPGILKTSGQF